MTENGQYFYIVKWSEYQHAQTAKWVKLYRSILQDADYVCATSNQRLSMLAALLVADDNGRFPNNQSWLNVMSGAEPFEIDFLLSIGYITADIEKLSTADDRTSLFLSNKPNNTKGKPKVSEGFEQFWKIYPRKVAKANALKAWHQVDGDSSLAGILDAVKKSTPGWLEGEAKFIPHAATWLRGERWTDEVEAKTKDQLTPDDAEYWS